jgi:hypothetical protein
VDVPLLSRFLPPGLRADHVALQSRVRDNDSRTSGTSLRSIFHAISVPAVGMVERFLAVIECEPRGDLS